MKKQLVSTFQKGVSFLLTTSLIISLAVFSSCEEDEEDGVPAIEANFLNQDIQGSVDGEDWTYATATAEDALEGIRILLSSMSFSDPCAEFSIQPIIQFQVFQKQEGLIDTNNGFSANFIGVGFVTGALDITSISATSLSGRADVTYTDEETGVVSAINGNFTATYCN